MRALRDLSRHLRAVDLGGMAAFLVALWGLALVCRGAIATSMAPHGIDGPRIVAVGSLLLFIAAGFLWTRLFRRAALVLVVPGIVALSTCVLTPGLPFAALALPAVPMACAAAGVAMGPRGGSDRRLVLWLFGITAVLGAPGTGAFALMAAMFVMVCGLLGPDPSRYAIPSIPPVPDDVSGL
jgi:hypothetical protein